MLPSPRMRFALIALVAVALAAGASDLRKPAAEKRGTPYGARPDVRAFAAEIARDTDLRLNDVERGLGAARFQPQIVALMQ
jgi:hypothetical protein